jgi:RimJ/RimL family protein N-acetyltransferase
MTVYDGPPIDAGAVALVAPVEAALRQAIEHSEGLTERERSWLDNASTDRTCLYFAIERDSRLVGQIILHDIDSERAEAMVGYHIFRAADRGTGTGAAALRALCDYAFGELRVGRLVIITTLDNAASRRLAEKCGFRETGPAREGPHLVTYQRTAR